MSDLLDQFNRWIEISKGGRMISCESFLIKAKAKILEFEEDKRLLRETIDAKSKALDVANAKCDELLVEIERLKGTDKPENPTLNDLWGNFDKAYFKFQSELYAFWGAIDVGRSRSFFADLYTNMHRLRRDMVSMLPDEVRNSKAAPKPEESNDAKNISSKTV